MREPVLAAYITKTNSSLKALGGLHHIQGNHTPYFSLTMEEYERGRLESCGASHEVILKQWPQFADLAALHLSDINGIPMHAEANGWYSLVGALPDNACEQYHAGASQQHFPKPTIDPAKPWETDYRNPTSDECLEQFARHVRVDVATATQVRDAVVKVWLETRHENLPGQQFKARSKATWTKARAWFGEWIKQQYPRWKAEADACIVKHGLVVYGDKWTSADAR